MKDESLMSNSNSSLSVIGVGGLSGENGIMNGLANDRCCNMNQIFIRMAEMEKKLADQCDEIVCLKSTLADVLRRLNQLEGRGMFCYCCFVLKCNLPFFR